MSDARSIFFLALIPTMWCFLSWLMSRLSGWSGLAKKYRASGREAGQEQEQGETAHLRSGRIGAVNYHSALTFFVNDDGLRISVPFFLRLGHPPLFLPWDQFHEVRGDGRLYSQKIKVAIGRPTLARMTLPGWVRYRMPAEMRAEHG